MDLLVDVVRAADPIEYQKKIQELRLAAQQPVKRVNPLRDSFSQMVSSAQGVRPLDSLYSNVKVPIRTVGASDGYKKYEAVILQSFVERMFGNNHSTVFGHGQAGAVWKSMLSEAIAKQMSDSGSTGIAEMLENSHNRRNDIDTESSNMQMAENIYNHSK